MYYCCHTIFLIKNMWYIYTHVNTLTTDYLSKGDVVIIHTFGYVRYVQKLTTIYNMTLLYIQ
jgi:hypothetical protein